MKCAEVHPNLGAFVLGGLEPQEAAEIRRHLALCPGCRNELQELEKINQALEAAPPPADPPRYLKDEILSHVRDEEPSSSNEESSSSKKNLRFVLPGVAAAALVAIVALGIFFGLQTETPVATVQLSSIDEDEEYWGVAEFYPQPSGNQLVELKLNDLDDPGPGSFYEMRFVSGEKYISAGAFTANSSGETKVWLTAPPEALSYRTLLITEESADNGSSPGEGEILGGELP